jgi:hypothetical protein
MTSIQRKSCIGALLVLIGLLNGCGGGGAGGNLVVTTKDFNAAPNSGPITVVITFNLAVDPTTVTPGKTFILGGNGDINAQGVLSWSQNSNTLTFTTTKGSGAITGPGGPDAGFTVSLDASIRSQSGSPLQQCAKGVNNPGAEPPGPCRLSFLVLG